MSGIQEILLILLIVLAIFFLPRVMAKRSAPKTRRPEKPMSGKIRLAVAASLIWAALLAAFLQPWEKDPFLFAYFGVGPVLLGWLVGWVIVGFRPKRR